MCAYLTNTGQKEQELLYNNNNNNNTPSTLTGMKKDNTT
jgi:hypothetical protein